MKLLIFAGGAGRRFWPIGRANKPKQFIKIFNGKSTYELTLERTVPIYGLYNIFVSTIEDYVGKIKELTPNLPTSNIFTEPDRRDVGPAVGLALMRLKKLKVKEPIAILWADHYIKNIKEFQNLLKQAEEYILRKKANVVLIGEEPKYPATNLGWIEIKKEKSLPKNHYKLSGFVYKPELKLAQKLYSTKTGLWNTAYMISTVDVLLKYYQKFFPELYEQLNTIYKYLETPQEAKILQEIYPQLPKIHFDHIVSYNLNKNNTIVLGADMGWTDPGTLYSFKNTMAPGNQNFIKGTVYTHKTHDSLVINNEPNKIVVTSNLNKMIVVNTKDALLVIPADNVKEIADIYDYLAKHPKYKKFTQKTNN